MVHMFLFCCAAMNYNFDFLPLLDAEVAWSLFVFIFPSLRFFNSTRTRNLTLILFCLGLSVREMEATALLWAVGWPRSGLIWEDLMMQKVGCFYKPCSWHGSLLTGKSDDWTSENTLLHKTQEWGDKGGWYSVLKYMKKFSACVQTIILICVSVT